MINAARVLVVEDQTIFARQAEQTLRKLGFTDIVRAPNVREGRREADARLPDLALLDINVGAEWVYALAADLRRRGVPLIFVANDAPQGLPRDLIDQPVLAKPVEAEALTGAIEDVKRSAARTSVNA